MSGKKALVSLSYLLLSMFLTIPGFAQGARGKAELKTGTASITIDYGRPALKGRDMLGEQKDGQVWRMGMNEATIIKTPVDLTFGSTKIPKGNYSLFLRKVAADKYELIFNSKASPGMWGTEYDASADVAKVPLKKESTPSSVESFTVELKEAPKGGTLAVSWGKTKLSADFQIK